MPKLKIGLSPLVYAEVQRRVLVDEPPRSRMDVTIMLASEDKPWVQVAARRVRPHFVNDLESALRILAQYEHMEMEEEPDANDLC